MKPHKRHTSRKQKPAGNHVKVKDTRKQESTRSRQGNKEVGSSETYGNILSQEMVECEILSRLPVKSLMRFKCVCKYWKLLIEQDKHFIDLHLSHSKTRPRLLINVPHKAYRNYFLAADVLFDGRGQAVTAAVHTSVRINEGIDWFNEIILAPVNGLTCFLQGTSREGLTLRVWNVSTQEVSPPIESTIQDRLWQKGNNRPICNLMSLAMGFSPATKEHKVILQWRTYIGSVFQPKLYYEVLTIGDNKWRKINDVPQYDIQTHGASVYVNGVIYFTTEMLKDKQHMSDKFIVAFDVSTEKFSSIKIPSFILDQLTHEDSVIELLEVNCCLGLLGRISSFTVKLWLYVSDEHNWSEVTMRLPYYWGRAHLHKFYSVGTDQIISHYCPGNGTKVSNGSLHSYNWKNMTKGNIQVSGIPKSVAEFSSAIGVTTYVESLLRVN